MSFFIFFIFFVFHSKLMVKLRHFNCWQYIFLLDLGIMVHIHTYGFSRLTYKDGVISCASHRIIRIECPFVCLFTAAEEIHIAPRVLDTACAQPPRTHKFLRALYLQVYIPTCGWWLGFSIASE